MKRLNLTCEDIELNQFQKWPLDFLCDFLVNSHHSYIREAIRQLISSCRQSAEGKQLVEKMKKLQSDFEIHMNKEEKFLFPYIKNLVKADLENTDFDVPPFGGLNGPADVMKKEHAYAVTKIKLVLKDSLSNNHELKEFFIKLENFEKNLSHHIEIENNLLFPRAQTLEKKLRNKSKTKNKIAS